MTDVVTDTNSQVADASASAAAEQTAGQDTSTQENQTQQTSQAVDESPIAKAIREDQEAAEKAKGTKKTVSKDGEIKTDTEETEESEETKDDETEEESDESKETKETEIPDAEEEKQKGAEARKTALQTEIRDLVAKRNEVRQEYETEIAKQYRTESVEELVGQGLDQQEAENEALKQEIQMREFNNHVSNLNQQLDLESLQIMQDFPVFDRESPLYDKDLAERAKGIYLKAANQKIDPRTGYVVQTNVTPYEIYKAFADTHVNVAQSSREQGRVEGQKDADQNLAAAETISSTAPKPKAEDPFLNGLLGNR